MKAKTTKPAPAAAAPPRPGTREHRDMQRAEFDRKMDAQKKRQK